MSDVYEIDDIEEYDLWVALQIAMWNQWHLYPAPGVTARQDVIE